MSAAFRKLKTDAMAFVSGKLRAAEAAEAEAKRVMESAPSVDYCPFGDEDPLVQAYLDAREKASRLRQLLRAVAAYKPVFGRRPTLAEQRAKAFLDAFEAGKYEVAA